MQLTAGLFASTETAYRHERISASFREASAARGARAARALRTVPRRRPTRPTLRAA
jgi:hypothetical protein